MPGIRLSYPPARQLARFSDISLSTLAPLSALPSLLCLALIFPSCLRHAALPILGSSLRLGAEISATCCACTVSSTLRLHGAPVRYAGIVLELGFDRIG